MLAASAGLLLLLPGSPRLQQGDVTVRAVQSPPAQGSVAGEEPLRPWVLTPLALRQVQARGWLQYQLQAMAQGMHGRLPEISPWLQQAGNGWLDPKGGGDRGWEELPYWLKGYVDLAYLTGDPQHIETARFWCEKILASQRPDGWFGPESNLTGNDLWPNMIALWALRSYYQATGDQRVLDCMLRYFRWQAAQPPASLLPGSWQKVRGGDELDVILWLYCTLYWQSRSEPQPWLLDLARTLHARTADWAHGVPSWHGVNICQGFREPAQYFQLSLDPADLAASEQRYREVMELYGQVPGGMFGADENCRSGYGDPRQAAEACSMVELMLSHEMLAGITGDARWADRCEDIAFNSLPAAFTPDLKALHYLTAPNQVQLDHEDHSPGIQNGGCMLAYSADEKYRCCQHNVAHGWPYFAEHLWMGTRDQGLAALLYAPSEVEFHGARITEDTRYPFDGQVHLRFALDQPQRFPLYLRVPGWCQQPALRLNGATLPAAGSAGAWLAVEREWRQGDLLELELPMRIEVRAWSRQQGAVSIRRGPLEYALRIGERWVRNGGSDAWPDWDVLPAGPWNYALVLDPQDPAGSLTVYQQEGGLAEQPFALGAAPVVIGARAPRLPEWGMQWGLVAPLQQSPARTEEPVEDVLLVPMGCARLRISVFPVAGGPEAARWILPPPPPAASHVHDDPYALSDGILPRSSADQEVPRFTWWDHLGTTEWVEYRYPEPRTLSSAAVYWFDDTGAGRCRVPASWRLLVEQDGAWSEVRAAGAYGVAADRMNEVRFEPVHAAAVRLEARLQDGYSAGILEWKLGPE